MTTTTVELSHTIELPQSSLRLEVEFEAPISPPPTAPHINLLMVLLHSDAALQPKLGCITSAELLTEPARVVHRPHDWIVHCGNR